MKISDQSIGSSARIEKIGGEGILRQHFLDMGLIPGAVVTLVKKAPMGDPLEIMIHGYSLTLRKDEASRIEVTDLPDYKPVPALTDEDRDFGYNLSLHEHNAHPGLGEEGKYHSKDHENPLPKGSILTFALAGQQNCGKTTLFNALTGSNQHVGNFPGVTVDRKDGSIKNFPDNVVTDLPGIYSLSAYTEEELVSRRFIIQETPSAIINVVDAGNIERNLYLTMQLMEMDVPVVLALNMMDELNGNGGFIRVNEMEKALGIPVVPISASKGDGIGELVEHTVHIAKYQERPAVKDFCDKQEYGGAVHRCLHSIMHLVEDHASASGIPLRFAASRLVEGDAEIENMLLLSENEKEMIEHIIVQMEEERGLDRNAAMADMRYSFIRKLCRTSVIKPRESKEHRRSVRIDRVLTGKWTAVPFFLLIMALIFWLTFDFVGLRLQGLLAGLIEKGSISVEALFSSWNVSPTVTSLVVDAVFKGVGTVISFIPVIIVLFFFLSLLEDSGYMARVAFVSDKLLRKIGLSGRSIVPLLIGFGCTVPAVMASRTLPSAHDRKLTILLTPFVSCSAKIAIYGFITEAFFPGKAGLIMIGLYLLGILIGIVTALVYNLLRHHKETTPFVMELPVYRMPNASNVGHLLWDKTKDFIQKAFSVIFVATVIVWFLQSFDFRLAFVADSSDSILASLAGFIAPLFYPLGLGDWRIVTALISGFLAKESVVSTLEVLGATALLTASTAVPMLVFCLLYTPCVASVSVIRRELGRRWSFFVIFFQFIVAWAAAFAAYILI